MPVPVRLRRAVPLPRIAPVTLPVSQDDSSFWPGRSQPRRRWRRDRAEFSGMRPGVDGRWRSD